ncbi:MAG: protein kinase [Deltaproteobacteria bacterium]|nr:protein kinase [Deltaproteobacteria bacterium]
MAEQGNVFGFYVLLRSLGSGGMGEVSLAKPLAENCGIPTPVVVKRLHSELATHEHFVRRFEHEAKIAAAISHSNVAKVYDAGRVDDTLYLTMQYIEGWSVAKVLEHLNARQQHVSIRSIADVVIGVLRGTGSLHNAKDEQGVSLAIVHRDICPKNVMLDHNREPCLIDFGLGKSKYQDWKTRTGTVMGTPGYMAPEQVLAEQVDHRTDLYACGIILWELLALRPYIDRGPLSEMLRKSALPEPRPLSAIRPGTSAELEAVALKALAREAPDRFNSAEEFIEALDKTVPQKEELPTIVDLIGTSFQTDLDTLRGETTRLIQNTKPRFGTTKAIKPPPETFAVRPDVAIGDLRTRFEEAAKAEAFAPSASDASYETIIPDSDDLLSSPTQSGERPKPVVVPLPVPLGRGSTPAPAASSSASLDARGPVALAAPEKKSKTAAIVALVFAALAATFLLGRISARPPVDVEAVAPMEPPQVGAKGLKPDPTPEPVVRPSSDTPPNPSATPTAPGPSAPHPVTVAPPSDSTKPTPRPAPSPITKPQAAEPVVEPPEPTPTEQPAPPPPPAGDDLASLSSRAQTLLSSAIQLQKSSAEPKRSKLLELIVRIQSEVSAPNRDRLDGLARELEALK